jgi:hypothetical protein
VSSLLLVAIMFYLNDCTVAPPNEVIPVTLLAVMEPSIRMLADAPETRTPELRSGKLCGALPDAPGARITNLTEAFVSNEDSHQD